MEEVITFNGRARPKLVWSLPSLSLTTKGKVKGKGAYIWYSASS